jgi:hypothetical protein
MFTFSSSENECTVLDEEADEVPPMTFRPPAFLTIDANPEPSVPEVSVLSFSKTLRNSWNLYKETNQIASRWRSAHCRRGMQG